MRLTHLKTTFDINSATRVRYVEDRKFVRAKDTLIIDVRIRDALFG